MVAAIIVGILVGTLSFTPLIASIRLARKASPTSNLGHAGALMLGVLLSFVILAATLVICLLAFREYVVPFAAAEAGALLVFATVFGFMRQVRR